MSREDVAIWLLLLGLSPAGLYVAGSALSDRTNGKNSLSWPVATGTVESVAIERTWVPKQHHTDYRPAVTYRYTVGSTAYTGTRVRFAALDSSDSSVAQAIADRYPVGKTLPVRYRPDKPDVSVLEPGAFKRSWLRFAGGLFAAVLGPLLWILRRRLKKSGMRQAAWAYRLPDEGAGRRPGRGLYRALDPGRSRRAK